VKLRMGLLEILQAADVEPVFANGINRNSLNTSYGRPVYEKNSNAKLVELNTPQRITIDFMTEKGKTYTIIPVN